MPVQSLSVSSVALLFSIIGSVTEDEPTCAFNVFLLFFLLPFFFFDFPVSKAFSSAKAAAVSAAAVSALSVSATFSASAASAASAAFFSGFSPLSALGSVAKVTPSAVSLAVPELLLVTSTVPAPKTLSLRSTEASALCSIASEANLVAVTAASFRAASSFRAVSSFIS